MGKDREREREREVEREKFTWKINLKRILNLPEEVL